MSKLDINFTDYKASGVYFIEKDNSIIDSVTTQSGRIAVGFSKKGPFNAPVYIDNSSDLAEVFGGPDTKLERKGVFLNRSVQTLIGVAPTYVLNLLPFDEEKTDKTTTINCVGSMTLGKVPAEVAEVSNHLKYQDLHDTSRFWKASADHLMEALPDSPINFANVGTSDFTLIVRKAEGLSGLSQSVRDWYGNDAAIPYKFMRPTDSIGDYFIEVICVDGNWTDPKLATDPFWKDYFTTVGTCARLKKDRVKKFMALTQVSVIGDWTGCVLPDFYDKTNALRSIKDIVNSYTRKTGLLMSVNTEFFEEATETSVDFVGHTAKTGGACQFMSYDFVYGNLDETLDTSTDVSVAVVDKNIIHFYKDSSIVDKLTVGTMVCTKGNTGSMTKVVNKRKYATDSSIKWDITVADEAGIVGAVTAGLTIVPQISDIYTDLVPKFVKGLDIDKKIDALFDIEGDKGVFIDNDGATHLGEDVPIARIYSVLFDKGIHRGLLNRDIIDFRYIVDTMGHGLGTELGSKKFLSKLAKEHERCTALLNAPSISEFKNCAFTSFYDADDVHRTFDAKYLPKGGNDEMIKSVEFSLPGEENGAKYCGVFSPFLKYRSGQKEILVPPAAEVSNTFMSKYTGGDPYVTMANLNGLLTGGKITGVEYEFDDTDRGYLEPMGINPILNKNNKVMIYGDRTAFQEYLTDYNYLHVRELLNTIEIECNAILQNYVFRYNNAATRAEIYRKINPILSAMQQSGALYKYELEMDENNNTDEVIDRSFAVLDLGVWITKNMEKVIARITVNKLSED